MFQKSTFKVPTYLHMFWSLLTQEQTLCEATVACRWHETLTFFQKLETVSFLTEPEPCPCHYFGKAFSKERIIGYPTTCVVTNWKIKTQKEPFKIILQFFNYRLTEDWISHWTTNTTEFTIIIIIIMQMLCSDDEKMKERTDNKVVCKLNPWHNIWQLKFLFFPFHTAVKGKGVNWGMEREVCS